jgi:YggT family protein
MYEMLIILRVVLSWTRVDPYDNAFVRILYLVTEPILEPIRNLLPPTGGIDFSPMVAMVAIIALQQLLSILAASL